MKVVRFSYNIRNIFLDLLNLENPKIDIKITSLSLVVPEILWR